MWPNNLSHYHVIHGYNFLVQFPCGKSPHECGHAHYLYTTINFALICLKQEKTLLLANPWKYGVLVTNQVTCTPTEYIVANVESVQGKRCNLVQSSPLDNLRTILILITWY